MADDLFDYDDEVLPRKKDNLFLWTVLIMLLVGAAFACWLGSFYIFGHPEEPRSYAILKKLKKIEPARRFDVTAAPQGEFLTPQKAFERFSSLTRLELERENAELLRIYIKNYSETKKLLPYLRGKFDVMQTRALTGADLVPLGTVSLMQATDYAQVVVEHLFPASGANIEASMRALVPGCVFPIEKTNDVTTIIHAERMSDGRMLLTVVPLHYPPYGVKGGSGYFATEPPAELNVAPGLPVTRQDVLDEALKRFAQSRSNEPVAPDASKPAPQGPELVRVDTMPLGKSAPETGAIPEPTVAKAEPVRPMVATPRPRTAVTELTMNTRPTPAPLPAATPLPVKKAAPVAALPVATPPPVATPVPVRPAATPPVVAMNVPPATPAVPPVATPAVPVAPMPSTSPTGVPLKPFVQSTQGVAPPTEASGAWRLFPPGAQPRGRNISSSEALNLVDQANTGERLYLSGNFRVSARGDNKAVLRPSGEALPAGREVRIVVEFPNGSVPPDEGEVLARDASRAFEVRAITRADDGKTVNVFVREVTR